MRKHQQRPVFLAKALLENGFKVVPINSKGVPALSGHLTKSSTYSHNDAEDWEKKYPSANIALVCGYNNVVALDFDVDDERLSGSLKRSLITKYNRVPIRESGSNRFAAIFRVDDSLHGAGKIISNTYKLTGEEAKTNQIELITNNILTIYGTHRKTGNEYVWRLSNPLNTRVASLPLLDKSAVFTIFKMFHLNVPEYYKKIADQRESGQHEVTTFDTVKYPNRMYTDEEIEQILENYDGTSRDNWLNAGFALHKHYKGSAEGFEVWDEWSSQFDGYGGRSDQEFHWGTFDSSGNMSMGSIDKVVKVKKRTEKAEERGYVTPEAQTPEEALDYMMTNYVMIQQGNEIGDMGIPVNESISKLHELLKFKCNVVMTTAKVDKRSGKVSEEQTPVMHVWMNSPERQDAWGTGYAPGANRLIPPGFWKDKQKLYYNEYVPPLAKMTDEDDLLDHFMDHMTYLFPNNGHTWMLNWMAQLVQEPQKRYRTSPFSISVYEETGRGWLTELLSQLTGVNNFRMIRDITEIVRSGAKSGYLENSTLMVINEVYVVGRKRFNLVQQLKTLLSDDLQEIDVKYGSHKYNEQVYMRVFFQSNHIDGMVINETDSRIQPFINRSRPKSKEYYDKAYRLLNDNNRFLNQVYGYLMRYDVDHSRLTSSEDTDDRRAVILSTKSPTGLAFYEFKQLVGTGIFTDGMLTDFVNQFNTFIKDEEMVVTSVKQLKYFKKANVHFDKTIRIRDRTIPIRGFEDRGNESDHTLFESLSNTRDVIKEHFRLLRLQEESHNEQIADL